MTVPPAVPSPAPAAQAPWNVLSIVGFVLSLIGFNVVAVILGFIGLSQVKKSGERGRGFALAAVIIGLLSIVVFVIVMIVAVVIAASNTAVTGY
ncbi:DUF4190 domain-containing protein [Luethyella okanaganae]|uniref:DUF4190 domain-containing protein n=1 Tax=Luethyella okanaganae TaxID=69372 RepID=A0ABW1VDG5_9MICO